MIDKQLPFWPDQCIYFLTGSTFLHYPYFSEEEQKQILLNQIRKVKEELDIPISAFSIAINHYHLKFYLENGLYLAKIRQIIHGGTSFIYKKRYQPKYQEIWGSSRVIIIKSEEMNWKVNGYIDGNLLKHKEVSTFQELKESPFSSFRYRVEKYGEEFAENLVREVIIVDEDGEGKINLKKLKQLKIKPAKAG